MTNFQMVGMALALKRNYHPEKAPTLRSSLLDLADEVR